MFSGLGNTHLVFINGYSDGGISAFGLYLYICIYLTGFDTWSGFETYAVCSIFLRLSVLSVLI